MDELDKVKRERIERLADEMDDVPDPGWEKMEETVREVRNRGGESNHPEGNGSTETHDQVESESGDLTRPVGTESDSY